MIRKRVCPKCGKIENEFVFFALNVDGKQKLNKRQILRLSLNLTPLL